VGDEPPKNLAERLKDLAKESDIIISRRETIEDLRARGVEIDSPDDLSPEEFVDRLFAERREVASEIISKFPHIPQGIQPNLGFLYNEIVECAIFGANGAAITLAGILIEFAVKQATYRVELGDWSYDAEKWDEFEKLTFHQAVKRARTAGVVNDKVEAELLRFKDNFRNPYSHYNIKKITSEVVAGKVRVLDTQTEEVEVRDIPVRDEPHLHAPAKRHVDSYYVLPVLAFAASVLRYLFPGSGGAL